MKKLLFALLSIGVVASLPATQFVFYSEATLLDSNGQISPDLFTVELGSFHNSLVPSAANVAAWKDAWESSGVPGYYDPAGPEWGAALTLASNDQFAVGEQLYLWAFDTRNDATAQWALFTDPTWLVTASSGLDPIPVGLEFTADTTAILGQFDFGQSVASLSAVRPGAGSAVPDSAAWGVIMAIQVAALGFWSLLFHSPRRKVHHV